ncbi:protein-(glutamine-N5) methyltransferase, release factor-specific [candidate division WOR-1 bacterium RIFOXYB2_FULL_48_7]|uniref:Release factor glutamine methyltransferase n=1 Tax=candidate division WOR-1 bacterium RIFOXYB2_FULL_48_7 TaxID=1802583 RepID=A0A1F4TWE3_UNCSA|nr:MAG: protein-(glutamine-N5) methyltransferase, release factor-specific [candidate division WOR-1 bacterium RIFOXYB2_FULL_48_7]
MTIEQALNWGSEQLSSQHIEQPQLEAELLLCHVLNIPRTNLLTNNHWTLEIGHWKLFITYIKRRASHEPTAYIVGYQPFYGLKIEVNNNVLIPRPETEQLVETIINLVTSHQLPVTNYQLPVTNYQLPVTSIADIGTGSGCIAIALAKYLPQAKVIGIDYSSEAIKLALNNAQLNGVSDRCCFLLGELLEPLREKKVDLIVANLPYIPSADIPDLQPEVKNWEPTNALDGGSDGLDYIRKVITSAPKHLNNHGQLIIEFGFGQAEMIRQLASGLYIKNEIINDYAGIPRFLIASM